VFLAEEDQPGGSQVVILSHGLWQRLFGGDPNVIGRSLTLNGFGGRDPKNNQFTVVGVLRPEFLLNEEIMPTVGSITADGPVRAPAARRRRSQAPRRRELQPDGALETGRDDGAGAG
jgi:MacB-like periplasmic core domain